MGQDSPGGEWANKHHLNIALLHRFLSVIDYKLFVLLRLTINHYPRPGH